MSADTLTREPVQPPSTPPAPADPRGRPVGRAVLGGLLIVAGVLWLLDAVGVAELRLRVLLPAALLLVGLALLATARRGGHGGLVATGIVLSVLVLVTAAGPVTPLGLAGDRTVSPPTLAALGDGYELGMGSLTIDLRDLDVPRAGTDVSARVGMGELIVVLPEGVGAEVRARAGLGDVIVLEADRGGVGVSVNEVVPGSPTIIVDVAVGMGRVEVRR